MATLQIVIQASSIQKSAYVKSVLPNMLPKRENKYRTAIRLK